MGDALALDPDRMHWVGELCRDSGRRSAELGGRARSALVAGRLPVGAATLLDELAEELHALADFVQAVVERAAFADRYGVALAGQGWYDHMRRSWSEAEVALWASLNDAVGASAIEHGSFSLDGSLVRIDRSRWQQAVIPPGCRSFGEGRWYTGGGAVRGPDGELYPIVVPHYVTDDGHFTIDADLPAGRPSAVSLGGADPGWHVIGYRTGTEQFRDDADAVMRTLAAVAVGTGLAYGPTIDDEHLRGVRLAPGALPTFSEATPITPGVEPSAAEASQSVSPTAVLMVDGRARQVPIDEIGELRLGVREAAQDAGVSTAQTARANLPANALSLAVGLLQGTQVAINMNNSNDRAYEVVFEENEDGRRRARVQTFALEAKADGAILSSWHVFVDDQGALIQSPAAYQAGSTVLPEDAIGAGNPIDPDLSWPVPRAAFSAEPAG